MAAASLSELAKAPIPCGNVSDAPAWIFGLLYRRHPDLPAEVLSIEEPSPWSSSLELKKATPQGVLLVCHEGLWRASSRI